MSKDFDKEQLLRDVDTVRWLINKSGRFTDKQEYALNRLVAYVEAELLTSEPYDYTKQISDWFNQYRIRHPNGEMEELVRHLLAAMEARVRIERERQRKENGSETR